MLMIVLNRKQTLPYVLGVVLCVFLVVTGLYSISKMEFNQSAWATSGRVPPALTTLFRQIYMWSWITATLTLLWGAALVSRKQSSIGAIGWFIATAAVQCAFWLMFMLLALYLANQTFKV